ncbi:MAG: Rab family GTPase [Candidatus Hermodarchaeota archaeon]
MTDYVFNKIIFFCEEGVGKTTFIRKYCLDSNLIYKKTLGVRFFKLKPDLSLHGYTFSLLFWDIAVSGSMSSLKNLYYKEAEAAIFMYDITNQRSLNYFPDWFVDIRTYSGNIPVLLVGNKIDLEKKHMASKNHAMTLKERFYLSSLLEISVKSGENIYNMFEELIKVIIKK